MSSKSLLFRLCCCWRANDDDDDEKQSHKEELMTENTPLIKSFNKEKFEDCKLTELLDELEHFANKDKNVARIDYFGELIEELDWKEELEDIVRRRIDGMHVDKFGLSSIYGWLSKIFNEREKDEDVKEIKSRIFELVIRNFADDDFFVFVKNEEDQQMLTEMFKRFTNSEDFDHLLVALKDVEFDDKKLQLIKKTSLGKISCSQCVEVLQNFTFTPGKIKAIKLLLPRIRDLEKHGYQILQVIPFISDKRVVESMIHDSLHT